MEQKKIVIIGAGFSGLSASCFLAKKGYDVTVIEKNQGPGGRAMKFETQGFTFDMGPSWYWMPDVFERFFGAFGKRPSDYYTLKRLDPSYRIFWGTDEYNDLPAKLEEFISMVEKMEKGGGDRLQKFLSGAKYKYEVGINKLVYKKSESLLEFLDPSLMLGILKMDVFKSFHQHVRKYFSNPKLIQMMEFPVLFLGGTPRSTPALYSLMNYGDIELGTWYPMGGMFEVVKGIEQLAMELGVKLLYDRSVSHIEVNGGVAKGVVAEGEFYDADVVIGSADYRHVEQNLIPPDYRTYSEKYWDQRTMSPSSLIFFLGINKPLPNILHHTLFFDEDFDLHAHQIYGSPQWPDKPSVYVSNTSKTDPSVAPEGKEALMILIPVATGLEDSEDVRKKYFEYVLDKLEKYSGTNIRDHIEFSRSYAHNDFMRDYNAFKGNAYGLANTLMQTAFLKPKMQSKKIKNLFYTGQLTVPGPGVPPALISGQVAAREIVKQF